MYTIYTVYLHIQALLCISPDLLHCTKLVGEQATNVFSSADKLSRQEKQGMGSNPVYGLKRDLIRVVGNLAYKNRSNQDRVSDNRQPGHGE